jgi:hypothetical protein
MPYMPYSAKCKLLYLTSFVRNVNNCLFVNILSFLQRWHQPARYKLRITIITYFRNVLKFCTEWVVQCSCNKHYVVISVLWKHGTVQEVRIEITKPKRKSLSNEMFLWKYACYCAVRSCVICKGLKERKYSKYTIWSLLLIASVTVWFTDIHFTRG